MTVAQKTEAISQGLWKVDPVHSSVGFEVQHLDLSPFRGEIGDYEAALKVDEEGAVLRGSGRVDAIRTGEEALDTHLRSPDFFDAERHPEIRLATERFGPRAGELGIEAALEIRGVTRTVVLRGEVSEPIVGLNGEQRLAVALEAAVDRTAYGLEWNAELPGGGQALANEVTLSARLELVRE